MSEIGMLVVAIALLVLSFAVAFDSDDLDRHIEDHRVICEARP